MDLSPRDRRGLADVVADRHLHNLDISTWRTVHKQPFEQPSPIDQQIAEVCQHNPHAVGAVNVALSYGLTVVPIDQHGLRIPGVTPTADPSVLVSWWAPGGPHEHRYGGVDCASAGIFVLGFNDDGWRWLRETATVKNLGRLERITAWLERRRNPDPVTALGVPEQVDNWEDAPDRTTEQVRDHFGEPTTLIEVRPDIGPVSVSFRGDGRQELLKLRAMHRSPHIRRWLVWRAVPERNIRRGELPRGVFSVKTLPCRDAIIRLEDGLNYRVASWSATSPTLQPPPSWLADALNR